VPFDRVAERFDLSSRSALLAAAYTAGRNQSEAERRAGFGTANDPGHRARSQPTLDS
jgi:hypothetical protein